MGKKHLNGVKKLILVKYLISGGAGFIGINAADYFLSKGEEVLILDNFSRLGSNENVNWLQNKHKKNLKITKADISKDKNVLDEAVTKVDVVLHLAAQVAVTTSVQNPMLDFETNALGTLNLLEAIRKSPKRPMFLYSSTNKVYGKMENIEIHEKIGRYEYANLKKGISEKMPLDFYSPYGCSKGSADQYTRDYSRIYGLKTVVFRQSCIYGYRQFGMEDQGWVAWFTIASILNKPITIYGDGKQVRDVLFINDLIKLYDVTIKNIEEVAGKVYNIGGGHNNTLSLLELINFLEELLGRKIRYNIEDWRPGDQKVFICDISKAKKELCWEPEIGIKEGVKILFDWAYKNKELFNF